MSDDIPKSENSKSESSTPIIVSRGAVHKAKRLHLTRLKVALWPAIIGLTCAILLVVVIAGYYWGATVSSNSSNYTSAAQAWGTALDATSILFALAIGIGLPVWWGRLKSNCIALASIAF